MHHSTMMRRSVDYRFPPRMHVNPSSANTRLRQTKDHATQLLRSIYPITRSGSKIISIGLDIDSGFVPSAILSKPGFPGVLFSGNSFRALIDTANYISECFEATDMPTSIITLGTQQTAEFTKQFNNRVVLFKSLGDEKVVSLTKQSWQEFLRIIPLLIYTFNQLDLLSAETQTLYNCLKSHIQNNFGPDKWYIRHEMLDMLEKTPIEDIGYTPAENTCLDVIKVFLEMKLFCSFV
jgi:hypothetical protein